MGVTRSPSYSLAIIDNATEEGSWGTITSNNLKRIESLLGKAQEITAVNDPAGTDIDLAEVSASVSAGNGAALVLRFTGTIGEDRYVNIKHAGAYALGNKCFYIITNATTGGFALRIRARDTELPDEYVSIAYGRTKAIHINESGAGVVTATFDDLSLDSLVADTSVIAANLNIFTDTEDIIQQEEANVAGISINTIGLSGASPITLKTNTVKVGFSDKTGAVQANGSNDLALKASHGLITVKDGSTGNIEITPNLTGKMVFGSGSSDAVITSSGAFGLKLSTDTDGGTSSITIADDGDITLATDPSDKVVMPIVDINGGTGSFIDNTIIGAATPAFGSFTGGVVNNGTGIAESYLNFGMDDGTAIVGETGIGIRSNADGDMEFKDESGGGWQSIVCPSVGVSPRGYISGMKITRTSVSTITVAADGLCRSSDNVDDIEGLGTDFIKGMSSLSAVWAEGSGNNGLPGLAKDNSTWYRLFALCKNDGTDFEIGWDEADQPVAGQLVDHASVRSWAGDAAPKFRQIGWTYINSGGDIENFVQDSNDLSVVRWVTAQEDSFLVGWDGSANSSIHVRDDDDVYEASTGAGQNTRTVISPPDTSAICSFVFSDSGQRGLDDDNNSGASVSQNQFNGRLISLVYPVSSGSRLPTLTSHTYYIANVDGGSVQGVLTGLGDITWTDAMMGYGSAFSVEVDSSRQIVVAIQASVSWKTSPLGGPLGWDNLNSLNATTVVQGYTYDRGRG